MKKYYTRACNFFYGSNSSGKVRKKISLPLNGSNLVSFDSIEILSKGQSKILNIKKIKFLNKDLKKKIEKDLRVITKKKSFKKLNFSNIPVLMGVINLTPDSFSDGGKYNKKKQAYNHAKNLVAKGCKIIDLGGESTRPGAKDIKEQEEWKRIFPSLKRIKKLNKYISLDTRKSLIMDKGLKNNVNLINDVSGLSYDSNTLNILKKTKIPFVIHHTKGSPKTMQKNPKYKDDLIEIFDFFENKIKELRKFGILHNNIILDPGIGFGKNLKHNMSLICNISIFHSLGFPILVGNSRKRFIKELSEKNDSKSRIGGTMSSSIYLMMQGVQILRVHDVNEIIQGLKVFKKIINN